MGYIYADMDALREFQQELFLVLKRITEIPGSSEEIVERATKELSIRLDRAEGEEDLAKTSLRVAENELSQAQARYSSMKDEEGNSVPVPSFYYDMVEEREEDYAYAREKCERAQENVDSFNASVARTEMQQQASLERVEQLMRQSEQFYDRYITLLDRAKKCTSQL